MNANKARNPVATVTLRLAFGALALMGVLSTGCDQFDALGQSVRSAAPSLNGPASGGNKDIARSWPINYYRH